MVTHPSDQIWTEAVRIAYHLHWSLDEVMSLPHGDRARVLHEIDALLAQPARR